VQSVAENSSVDPHNGRDSAPNNQNLE